MSTVGRDEEAIRAYIRNQEKEDQRLERNCTSGVESAPFGGSKLKGPVSDPSCRFERLKS